MRYLFISYNSNKSLKESQWYDDLEQVKKERGITQGNYDKGALRISKVSSYSSPDGSGCFLLDFIDGSISMSFEHLPFEKTLVSLMKQVTRDEKLKSIGV